MKLVEWEDDRGVKRRSWVRDADGPEQGKYGIPATPPDLDLLDWDSIKAEITETLSQQGVFNWQDWQRNSNGASAAMGVFKRHLVRLFRQQVATNGGHHGQ